MKHSSFVNFALSTAMYFCPF